MKSNLVGPMIAALGVCVLIVGLFLGVANEGAIACEIDARAAERNANRTEYIRGKTYMLETLKRHGVVLPDVERILRDIIEAERRSNEATMEQMAKIRELKELNCDG